MHRVTEERTHRECGWKHGGGHGVIALDGKEPPRRLDKQCLLMEVRLHILEGSLSLKIIKTAHRIRQSCSRLEPSSLLLSITKQERRLRRETRDG
jgi:hypothetical protein